MNIDFSSSNKTMELVQKIDYLHGSLATYYIKEIENEIACDCVGYVL